MDKAQKAPYLSLLQVLPTQDFPFVREPTQVRSHSILGTQHKERRRPLHLENPRLPGPHVERQKLLRVVQITRPRAPRCLDLFIARLRECRLDQAVHVTRRVAIGKAQRLQELLVLNLDGRRANTRNVDVGAQDLSRHLHLDADRVLRTQILHVKHEPLGLCFLCANGLVAPLLSYFDLGFQPVERLENVRDPSLDRQLVNLNPRLVALLPAPGTTPCRVLGPVLFDKALKSAEKWL